MRALTFVPFVLAGALGIGGSLAFVHHPQSPTRAPSVASPTSPRVGAGASAPLKDAPQASAAEPAFADLPALRFSNQNTGQSAEVRLYDDAGYIDERAAAALDTLLCDTRDPKHWATLPLDRRTLQLVVRAAFHFRVGEVQVVSAYRKPARRAEGPHANGKAIDFKLPGVAARTLAAYLRTLPRVGVGIYTHPKTSFAHLDDREHSFHWLAASPPGRRWREMSIGGAALGKRDASYVRADDWPEGTTAPP